MDKFFGRKSTTVRRLWQVACECSTENVLHSMIQQIKIAAEKTGDIE